MGTKVNALSDANSLYSKSVRRLCDIMADRMNKPWLYTTLSNLILGSPFEGKKLIKIIQDTTNRVIEDKIHQLKNEDHNHNTIPNEEIESKRKTAFLELLVQMKLNGNPAFTTVDDIREEVDTFMFEGHDTISSALCFLIQMLAKHPKIQQRVYEELVSIYSSEEDFTYRDLSQLKYMEQCIKESLRLFPSVPIVARQLNEELVLPSGYTLPINSSVVVNIYSAHRNHFHYSDPETFNPDNFLPEAMAKRHPFAYIPFSAGPRNCLGQKFAMLEMKSTIAKLLLNFELSHPDDNVTLPMCYGSLVIQAMEGHKVVLRPREQ